MIAELVEEGLQEPSIVYGLPASEEGDGCDGGEFAAVASFGYAHVASAVRPRYHGYPVLYAVWVQFRRWSACRVA